MNKMRVAIPAWILERKIVLLYLVINEDFTSEFNEMVQIAPEKKFYDFVAKHINASLRENIMPPVEISPAIMNLIDDYKSGRSMTLRTGDYISLQNYFRKGK